jgi:hypothetical protein
MAQLVTLRKGPQKPAPLLQAPDLFDDFDFPEDALPLKFFLACLLAPGGGCEAGCNWSAPAQPPRRRRPSSRMRLCSISSTS